jgi:hypothetical protein
MLISADLNCHHGEEFKEVNAPRPVLVNLRTQDIVKLLNHVPVNLRSQDIVNLNNFPVNLKRSSHYQSFEPGPC